MDPSGTALPPPDDVVAIALSPAPQQPTAAPAQVAIVPQDGCALIRCASGHACTPHMYGSHDDGADGGSGAAYDDDHRECRICGLGVDAGTAGVQCRPCGYDVCAKCVPRISFATQWVDEEGILRAKRVQYRRSCPRSHVLVPLAPVDTGSTPPLCNVCQCICVADDAAASPHLCCKQRGCSYHVCLACQQALEDAEMTVAPAALNGDDFPLDVRACTHFLSISTVTTRMTRWQGLELIELQELRTHWGAQFRRLTTEQAVQMLIRPLTARTRGSVCDELRTRASRAGRVKRANWFVSHVWSGSIADLVDAVLLFFEDKPEDAARAVVWLDFMSCAQHEKVSTGPSRSSDWWMGVFKNAIGSMGNLLSVMQPWHAPAPLKRAW